MSKQAPLTDKDQSRDIARGSTALLSIDLSAIGENYAQLRALAKGAECSAVVKADAYGTGINRVAPYLHAQGCKTFFVASPREGIELRALLPEAKVYILDGYFSGLSSIYLEYDLSPVLGSHFDDGGMVGCLFVITITFPRAALHIDTGMNRLRH